MFLFCPGIYYIDEAGLTQKKIHLSLTPYPEC